jgi:anti-sigma factor RsiW
MPLPAAPGRRLGPYALAASLVLVVGGAFVYQATDKSARVLAAELTADHMKCLALNHALGTHDAPASVEAEMAQSFDWRMHLPEDPSKAGMELVGSRPCVYGEGKIAHIMYRHEGRLVSLFMLPKSARPEELVEVLGHQAKIWCVGNRTFVLVAREPRANVERMASFVQASLH